MSSDTIVSKKKKQTSSEVSLGNLSGPGGSGLVRLQPSHAHTGLPSSHPKQELTVEKAQKKTFTPTIPAGRRIKKVPAESLEKPIKGASGSFRAEKKGRKKEKKDVIKSESVFSMGPAGKSTQERESRGSFTSGTTSGISIEHLKKRPHSDVGKTPSNLVSKVSMDDQEDADLEMVPSQDLQDMFSDSKLPPVQLPLSRQQKQVNHSLTAAELLTTAADDHLVDGNYLFMQLPDCLPICVDPIPGSDTGDAKAEANALCNVPEGRIGKLRIHESGKISLVLGAVSLDVSMGTPCGFLQELVCIRPSSPDPKMTSFGHLSHKLMCTPDFEDALMENSR